MSEVPTPDSAALRPTLRWLYSFLVPERYRLSALLALSLLVSLSVLAQPYLTKLIIDNGLLAGDVSKLVTYALLLLGTGIAATLLAGYNRLRYTAVSSHILFSMREQVYQHLTHLPPDFFAGRRIGDLASRLDRDVAQVQRFAVDTLFSSVSSVIGLVGTLGMMLYLDWRLSLSLLVLVPLEVVALRWLRPKVHSRNRAMRQRGADIASFFAETLPAMKFIQSACAEEREAGRLSYLNKAFLGDLMSLQKIEWLASAIPTLLVSTTRALVFLLGGYWVIQGQLALGSLVAFSAYLAMAFNPVQSLLGLYLAWSRMLVSLERVKVLRDASPEPEPAAAKAIPDALRGDLVLENLAFHRHACILDGVNASVAAGQRLALSGPSGSGKTTLVDLIQRHLTPRKGRILIDGMDIAEFDRRAWRQRIGVVAQEPVIFADSLLNNLRYCQPQATEEEVSGAAQRAGLEKLIERLPEGLHSQLSERGASLSGGERQRVALARALLQQPVLLILDEPTSAMETELESQLLSEVDRLFPNTTVILISHRPSIALPCQKVLTLPEGQLTLLPPSEPTSPCAASV